MRQGANSVAFIADRALAPTAITDELLVDGPFSREALAEIEGLLASDGDGAADAKASAVGECTETESRCLRTLEERIDQLVAAGTTVGGVVVEYVLSKGVVALRPAFLAGLRCGAMVRSHGSNGRGAGVREARVEH